MKTAILQVADTGPLESLVVMLQSVGYRCYLPSSSLKEELRRIGCDTVLNVADLVRTGSYEQPMELPEAGFKDMDSADLYVDIKAHRCYNKVTARWPNFKGRVLWYRINGGKPEHVVKSDGFDCGDEIDPPCPILTPNQWYSQTCLMDDCNELSDLLSTPKIVVLVEKSYCCWPPFVRLKGYLGRRLEKYSRPMCLVHNLVGWGYGALVSEMQRLGVAMYGDDSPDGPLRHDHARGRLMSALAYVHLKSSDAPGYALYEAMASGCPVVCSRRLIWRMQMQELLIPGKTCLTFDRETHDGLTDKDVEECTVEIRCHLRDLSKPDYNRQIGDAGREQLMKVMWSASDPLCVDSLASFMGRNFR